MDSDKLWAIERALWLDGASAYDQHLAEESLMLFPQMGIMERDDIIDSIAQGPRWREVQFSDQRCSIIGETALLAYVADAKRDDAPAYQALCSSVYVATAAGWRLLGHQQTPQS